MTAKIRNGYLQNTSLEHYKCISLLHVSDGTDPIGFLELTYRSKVHAHTDRQTDRRSKAMRLF
jgi:hypothetical protein